MACNNIKSFTLDLCEGNVGGVSEIYLANFSDVTGITTGSTTALTDDGITSISMSGTTKFEKFPIKKNAASFTSTLTVNDNGSSYISTVLSFNMPRMKADKRAAMQALILSECLAIIKDSNGAYWMIGDLQNPLTATAGTGETGTAKGDANQYTVELTSETPEWCWEILPSAVDSVVSAS